MAHATLRKDIELITCGVQKLYALRGAIAGKTVRAAMGIENAEDLIADLRQALLAL